MQPDQRIRGSGMHIAVRPVKTVSGVLSCDAIVGDVGRRCMQRIGAGRFAQEPRRACGNFSRIAVTVFQSSCSYCGSSSETLATPCPRQRSSLVLGSSTSMMTVPSVYCVTVASYGPQPGPQPPHQPG